MQNVITSDRVHKVDPFKFLLFRKRIYVNVYVTLSFHAENLRCGRFFFFLIDYQMGLRVKNP